MLQLNEKYTIKFKRFGDHDLPLPSKKHDTDAGLDLRAVEDCQIQHGCIGKIKTGFGVELPPNTVGLICARSGLGGKGLSLANSLGVIDVGYCGEMICAMRYQASQPVMPISFSPPPFRISKGDRIAQLLIVPCILNVETEEVKELEKTQRGEAGLGSSGIS